MASCAFARMEALRALNTASCIVHQYLLLSLLMIEVSDCTHVAAPCPPPRAGRPTPAPPRPTPGCWPRPWRWEGGCRCPASWASSRPPAGPASPPPSQPASTPPSSSQVHNQLLMILQNLSNMFPNPDIIHIEASTINYSISKSSATLLDCVRAVTCRVGCNYDVQPRRRAVLTKYLPRTT